MQQDRDTTVLRVQLAWGQRGAQAAADREDILVVVDTLRFSTAAATAVHHGAVIYRIPYVWSNVYHTFIHMGSSYRSTHVTRPYVSPDSTSRPLPHQAPRRSRPRAGPPSP
jgi:hypothetical protein